jgi:hypothetical protein
MTREECLKVVQAMWKYKDCGYSEYEIREALDGVLRVMEQDPMSKLERIKEIIRDTKWILVSEKLPRERKAVLVYCPERKNIYCGYYEEKQWWIYGAYFTKIEEDVIAWQTLPKPYEYDI